MPMLDGKMYSEKEAKAIRYAIGRHMEFDKRLAQAVASGLTDEELKAWLGCELGEHGGAYGCIDMTDVTVTGMSNPQIWFGRSWFADEPPALSGKHLLNVTRQLYGIGLPNPKGQLTLF